MLTSSHSAHRKTAQARQDFTDEQVAMLIDRFDTTLRQVGDIVDMLERYAAAGGRDYDTYERMFDHRAREGTHFTQGARSALAPEVWNRAGAAVAEAAGVMLPDGGMREVLHQRVAIGAGHRVVRRPAPLR